jgi:L-lactate dehydrogenase (cytochrome)
MAAESFDYICGGAGSEDTVRENLAAFRRWRIVPRMLTDVSAASFASTVLGAELAAPILLGPVGVLKIAHPDGEVAVARAAAATGVPMIMSTAASCTIEEVGEGNGSGQRWFQLYWPKDRAVARSFLARAKAAGFSVLVLTLDTRLLGYRPRDLDRAYLPFLRGIGNQNYFSDPAFEAGLPGPAADHHDAAILHWVQTFGDASLTWADLPFLREAWEGPIVLKGIQSVADAHRAADAGMDGIVVSNHGGRQLDGGIASLDALPAIAEAVGSHVSVLFDSGIRGGADIVKALALGARAVLVARPYAYALGLAGVAGVVHVLRALRQDFELTMRLAGCACLADLTRDSLARVP